MDQNILKKFIPAEEYNKLNQNIDSIKKNNIIINLLNFTQYNYISDNIYNVISSNNSNNNFTDNYLTKSLGHSRLLSEINKNSDIIINNEDDKLLHKYNTCFLKKVNFINKHTGTIPLSKNILETKKEIKSSINKYFSVTSLGIWVVLYSFLRFNKFNRNRIEYFYITGILALSFGFIATKFILIDSIFLKLPKLPANNIQKEKENIIKDCLIWDYNLLLESYKEELLYTDKDITKLEKLK